MLAIYFDSGLRGQRIHSELVVDATRIPPVVLFTNNTNVEAEGARASTVKKSSTSIQASPQILEVRAVYCGKAPE